MTGKTNTKSLNGKPAQTKARTSRELKISNNETERAPTREVVLEDGTVGRLSLYKAQRGRKRFTKEERERIALWRAIFATMEEEEQMNS